MGSSCNLLEWTSCIFCCNASCFLSAVKGEKKIPAFLSVNLLTALCSSGFASHSYRPHICNPNLEWDQSYHIFNLVEHGTRFWTMSVLPSISKLYQHRWCDDLSINLGSMIFPSHRATNPAHLSTEGSRECDNLIHLNLLIETATDLPCHHIEPRI